MVRLFALPLCLVVKLRPLRWLPWFISAALLACGLSAAPVEFAFYPPETPAEENTFAREFWAEIHSPSGDVRLLPAFYAGDGRWAVRTRADQAGTFRIGRITESTANGITDIAARLAGPHEISVERPDALPAVTIDPRQPRRFVTTDGDGFFPFGANFAWAMGEPDDYYPPTLAAARDAGLNWARVWMAHWGRLNLDWRAPEDGPSPALGTLDLSIAARWDRLIAVAERTEVRLQVVLQHHGQYSSLVNSNWAINPWNVANGGFLATPTDFFTSAQARRLIRQKYRYIVARWGYSPAIFAWELFNEVKWTDARTGPTATIASNLAVAAWHAEMARYIRSLDTHRHLVTTSDDALDHALYAAMDFFQPHLYANNLLASVRHFDRDPATLDRPIFYGEVGDDNMTSLPVAFRDNGYSNVPLAWAGAMGQSPYPAQIWYVQRLLDHGGLGPLASLGRFLRASGVTQRSDLQAFVAATQGGDRMPYTIEPGTHWHRMASPTIDV
ncbi:MAG TPA: hypothetical protein VHF69_02095, partial [Candidatus Synoicihabitans sp.]|nr:hypothetical protein [Candidatus Synoicihabitans sp.]